MTLDSHCPHPSERAYVIKLDRDAAGERRRLSGRVEHLSSGDRADFANGDQLLAWLARHVAGALSEPERR
jgi:hypothetical protein